MHAVQPLVPEPSSFEFEITIGNLRIYKSPGIDQIPAELIKLEVTHYVLRFTYLLLILFEVRTFATAAVSVIVPFYKRGDKIDCSNYRGVLLLPSTYKMLSSIPV
jgi:hypothetical protein